MKLHELELKAQEIIDNIKNKGIFKKENTLIDYKLKLKINTDDSSVDCLLKNFAKDILAFANKDGGILLIGFEENKETGKITENGLDDENLKLFESIDLKNVSDKIFSMCDAQINFDINKFTIGSRIFYYILIEKHDSILVPKTDFLEWNIKKGDIIYRGPGGNIKANEKTSVFNTFIENKVNEKNKDFMQIWSHLLPEVFNINPKEVLIINPTQGRVYGYDSKNNNLIGTDIEVETDKTGPINVILNAISAGEIGKISPKEGKPIYKIVGEITSKKTIETSKESTTMTSILRAVKAESNFNISSVQLKSVMHYLKWTNNTNIVIEDPKDEDLNSEFKDLIWIKTTDDLKGTRKIVFSPEVIPLLLEKVNNPSLHMEIFNDSLHPKNL